MIRGTLSASWRYRFYVGAAVVTAILLSTCLPYTRSASAQPSQVVTVRIIVEHVTGLDPDNIDPGKGPPDFYTKISIGETQHTSGVVDDTNDIAPNWSHALRVDRNQQSSVPVTIELFDEDGPFDGDDRIDINPSPSRDLNLAVDLEPCLVHGDMSGACDASLTVSGDESEKASIQIRVEVTITAVTVVIERVTGLDPDNIEDEFNSGDPDFYTEITINGQPFTSPEFSEANDIAPNWTHFSPIDVSTNAVVPVLIELWENDDPLSPDHIDISPDAAGRDLSLAVDMNTCQVSGDVSGSGCTVTLSSAGTSTNRATIQFRIEISKEPSVAPPVDLVASGLEVTQAIQDLNNSVRLVAGKRTFIRFHVFSTNGTQVTTARLHVSHQESPDIEVSLEPVDTEFGTNLRVLTAPNRRVLEHSFLFELPSAYTTGNIRLLAELNPDLPSQGFSPIEERYDNNVLSTTVSFEPVPSVDIYVYRVGYGDPVNPTYPPESHLDNLESWLRRAYPISDLQFWRRTQYVGAGLPSCDDVNSALVSITVWDDIFTFLGFREPSGPRHYGMVFDAGGFMRGCAYNTPELVASGPTGVPQPGGQWGWDTDGSYGDWYGGHELGHAYGRPHAPFCGTEGSAPYPYPGGRISADYVGPTALYGFDTQSRDVYDPSWTDMMTYCDSEWISDFTYESLMTYFQENDVTTRTQAARVNQVDRLLLVGEIDLAANTVHIGTMNVIPNAADVEVRVPGDYAIVLRDAAGTELARYPFTPQPISDRPLLLSFSELVPFIAGTARIDIENPQGVLATIDRGIQPPTIAVIAPNGGETLAGDVITVSWTASDPDSDPLTFNVQYSADNGQTWEMVALNVTGNSAQIDRRSIRTSAQALFRVWASDGIHITSDISDAPFVVPNRNPTATIVTPLDGAVVSANQTLFLGGDAYDVDSGPLPKEQMQWVSSLDGLVATGEQASVTGLSVGIHTLTFRADDGQGGVATDTVQITVVTDASQLPPVANGLVVGPDTILLDPELGITESPLYIDNRNLATSIPWNASSDQSWLVLSKTAGATPDELVVTFTGTGLPAGDYRATLTVTSPDLPGQQVQVQVLVTLRSDLSITKVSRPEPVIAGSTLEYEINVANQGPAPSANVTLVDSLPPELVVNSVTPADNCRAEQGKLTCNFPTLALAESRSVVVNTTVGPAVADNAVITNTVVVTQAGNETTLNNNIATVATTVIRRSDLSLGHGDTPDPVPAGGTLTYVYTVTNQGPSLASGVTLSATLPPGFTYNREASNAGCSGDAGVVTCTLGTLSPTLLVQVPIVVSVDPTIEVRKVLSGTARVWASEIDPLQENNVNIVETTVTRATGLSITQKRLTDPVFTERPILYQLEVRNMGDSIATGVILTNVLPLEVAFDAGGTSPGCTTEGQLVTCDLGTVTDGSSKSVQIAGNVLPSVTPGTIITNVAGVRSDEPDPLSDDNTSSDTAIVHGLMYLSMISNQPPVIIPGEVDLIVKAITVTEENLQVTIKNVGPGAILPGDDFWVDLYIHSPVTPTMVNQTWQKLEAEGGIVWGVMGVGVRLGPQDELTLQLNDQFYVASQSRIPDVIRSDTPLHVQVDSANIATDYGGVLEIHEKRREYYNNVASIVLVGSVATSKWQSMSASNAHSRGSGAAMIHTIPRK